MEFRPVDIPGSEWDKEPPVHLPPDWDPRDWGWGAVYGTYDPESKQAMEFLVRTEDDPDRACWVTTYYEPGEAKVINGHAMVTHSDQQTLYNPVIIQQENGNSAFFRVTSAEELQELLTQVERHGYAEAQGDGWNVHATPTAAMAKDAVEQGRQRRLVTWDPSGSQWIFTDAAIPVPTPGVAAQSVRPSAAPAAKQVPRTGTAREAPGLAEQIRDAADRLLSVVRRKRPVDPDVPRPQQGPSRGGPRW